MREGLLVDAYNLFHAARASSHARLFPDIKRLAFLLEHYASGSAMSVTLVIDGTRLSDEFTDTPVLKVLCSRAGETADAMMEAWMARLAPSDRLSWVLVSNDLNLCRMGAGMGLRVRPCAEVIDDLARFAGSGTTSVLRNTPPAAPQKPFNNPFGKLSPALCVLAAVAAFCASSDAAEFSGFSQPDAVVCDTVTGEIYVSNTAPAQTEPAAENTAEAADTRGFISRISGNGLALVQKFIQGKPEGSGHELRAPRGLAVYDGKLYVADGRFLRVYRADTGEPLTPIEVDAQSPPALGPVTVGRKGEIYAADAESSRIFKIETTQGDRVTLVADVEALKNPRGLAFDAGSNRLLVVTQNSGQLVGIDVRGKARVIRKGLGSLDGLFIDAEGTLFLLSADRGEVYRIPDRGRGILGLAASGQMNPSGIGYDPIHHEVLILLKTDGRLTSAPAADKKSWILPKRVPKKP